VLAGFVCPGVFFTLPSTELEVRRDETIAKVNDVTMKITADHVVAFESRVAAPRGPKAVWLLWPPNAAAMSALLPVCNSTTPMRKKHTRMCRTMIAITI